MEEGANAKIRSLVQQKAAAAMNNAALLVGPLMVGRSMVDYCCGDVHYCD